MRIYLHFMVLLSCPMLSGMESKKITKKNHIIFELDDVLFHPDPLAGGYLEKLKLGTLTKAITGSKIKDTQNDLIELIRKLDSTLEPHEELPEKLACYDQTTLPIIWCLYLMNKKSGADIIELAKQKVDAEYRSYNPKKQIIREAIDTSFTPSKEASIFKPIDGMIAVLDKLAAQKNNKLYILANKHGETLENLQKKHTAIFKLFKSRIHTSGKTGLLKPNNNAYQHFLESFKLKKENCFIIERIQSYCDAASENGIKALLYNGDAQNLESKLRENNLLQEN